MLDSSYTRLPVYKDDPENIIGVIHAKDLARIVYRIMSNPETASRNFDSFDIRDVAMEPYFVPTPRHWMIKCGSFCSAMRILR